MVRSEGNSSLPGREIKWVSQLCQWSEQDASRMDQLPWAQMTEHVLARCGPWLSAVTAEGGTLHPLNSDVILRMMQELTQRLVRDPLDAPPTRASSRDRGNGSMEPGVPRDWVQSAYWFILRAMIDVLFDDDEPRLPLRESVETVIKRVAFDALSTAQQHVSYYAFHDIVTACANRLATQLQLETWVRMKTPFVLFSVDLDGFKAINDTYGHNAGDMVLHTVAERWQQLVRHSDWLGRWGGDEFLMLLQGSLTPEAISSFANRIRKTSEESITLPSLGTVQISSSYGYARYPDEGDTISQLLDVADRRLYATKRFFGRGIASTFVNVTASLNWPQRVQQALNDNRIDVHYQPIIATNENVPHQWEALVRYYEVDGKVYYPGEFLLALSTDDMRQVDRAVLRQVFENMTRWHAQGQLFGVAINVDPSELLTDEWHTHLRSLHKEFPLIRPEEITFEIRESLTSLGNFRLIQTLGLLQYQGYHVALDDFGTGTSTLAHLQRLPIDVVKIDGTLTKEWSSEDGRVLIQSIISLSKPMGFQVIAEGVETRVQKNILYQWGCHGAQGWLYGPAIPASEVMPWILEHSLPDEETC